MRRVRASNLGPVAWGCASFAHPLTSVSVASGEPMTAALTTVLAIDWSWLALDWSMRSVYLVCALIGGVILILQTLLLMVGFDGGESDFDYDTDADIGDGSFSFLSVRAITSFLTFFGLAGLGGMSKGWSPGLTLAVAVGAGFAVMLVVAAILRAQMQLASKGNVDPKNAIGSTANVYLRIPAKRGGQGKITVSIQGRSQEFLAVTGGEGIPTGDAVRIVSMPTPGVFEVVRLNEE